jgi:hypothetical protein
MIKIIKIFSKNTKNQNNNLKMLSRLLILPQEIQQVRQLTQSTVNKARHGFRRAGTGFAQLVSLISIQKAKMECCAQNIKEAFAPGKAVPTLRERLLGPTTGKRIQKVH